MNGSFFFDTNILVYAVSQLGPTAPIARKLIGSGGLISVQVLNEFTNVARNKRKLAWPAINAVIAEFRLTLDVVPVTIEVHERGLWLTQNHSFALYDAMIVAAAELAGFSVLYTEDMNAGFVTGGLTLVNPFMMA